MVRNSAGWLSVWLVIAAAETFVIHETSVVNRPTLR